MFGEPTPVFAGAMSSNPGSMTDSTMPGESETVTFMAERPGTYALVCYIPAQAATGMWITLEVTPDGDVSFDPDPCRPPRTSAPGGRRQCPGQPLPPCSGARSPP